MDRSARRLAIVGIDEHPVGQAFDPLRDPVEDPVEASVERIRDLRREAQLDDLARRVPGDEVARRPLGDDLRLVHDDEAIAELLGLVHVVGRQDERRASLLEPVEAVPDEVACLWVEASRRLVEEHEARLIDQRAGDRQAPLHAAGQRLDLGIGAIGQLDELEQVGGPPARLAPGQVEVAAIDDEVVAGGHLLVEPIFLGDDADPRPDRRTAGVRIHPEDPELATRPRRDAADHAHRRRLPRPVRAEEAECLATRDVEVDRVDGRERAEALGQATGVDERGRRIVGDLGHGPGMVPQPRRQPQSRIRSCVAGRCRETPLATSSAIVGSPTSAVPPRSSRDVR